jgi:hypothetical protein
MTMSGTLCQNLVITVIYKSYFYLFVTYFVSHFAQTMFLLVLSAFVLLYRHNTTKKQMRQESGSAVCWGTMLQAGKSRVWIPLRSVDISVDLILLVTLCALGSTQTPTEWSTRNLPRVRGGRPERNADDLTTMCADCLDNVGSLTSHNPIGLHGLLRGYLYFMEPECASCEVRTGL